MNAVNNIFARLLQTIWRQINSFRDTQYFQMIIPSQEFTYELIIIIIISCRQHGYPRPSLTTSQNRSSALAGLQGYIPYPHIAVVCMFELVARLLLGHIWGPNKLKFSPLTSSYSNNNNESLM